MTDHDEIRAVLELACVEPGGLDRIEAGDTADAAAVVTHLVGCPSCSAELARLHRTDTLLRPMLAAAPSAELRARTLAFVREVGRDRSSLPGASIPADLPIAGKVPAMTPLRSQPRPFRPTWLTAAVAMAAVLIVGILGGAALGGNFGRPAGNGDPSVALAAVSREASRLMAARDVREVVLADATGATRGSLMLSPTVGRMLALATDLPELSQGRVYRCWVEANGTRSVLGTMWRAGAIAWWSGPVNLPANLPYDAVYGVSVVDSGSTGAAGDSVLTGRLVEVGS